ncbi:MAG: alpha/beta hydrolase [Proteobacteria bacterium]|nr:alpha/beta hydrolase [Pseudomonadota bacterium]
MTPRLTQPRTPRRLAGLLLAAFAAAASATPGAAPPLKIGLDEFEQARKVASLPNGMSLGYAEWGNPAGRPVVLIHGFTDNARDWLPLLPELDPGFRVILVDIRGHGRSSRPECCYGRLDFAYDVKLLLDQLHVERADIVGHSLGSFIAQTFAEFWPERTRRVVLVSSSGGPRAGCTPPGKAAKAFDFRSAIAKLQEPLDPDSPFMIEWWSSPTPVNEEFIRRQRQDSAAIPLRVWLAVLDQGLAGPALADTLPRLKAPALLIWGLRDPIFVAKDRCSLRAALPHATVKLFPTLGHNPFWEQPEAVGATINGFLNESP